MTPWCCWTAGFIYRRISTPSNSRLELLPRDVDASTAARAMQDKTSDLFGCCMKSCRIATSPLDALRITGSVILESFCFRSSRVEPSAKALLVSIPKTRLRAIKPRTVLELIFSSCGAHEMEASSRRRRVAVRSSLYRRTRSGYGLPGPAESTNLAPPANPEPTMLAATKAKTRRMTVSLQEYQSVNLLNSAELRSLTSAISRGQFGSTASASSE